jgi:hypothetical protein
MKKVLSLFVLSAFMHSAFAQPSPSNQPTTSASGQIKLADNTSVEGSVQDNVRKKGELIITSNGKKTRYKAGDINGAVAGNITYITWNYTFYEIVFQGKNLTLLRKANEPAGVQHSGSNTIVVSSEGNIDDLFIRKNNDPAPQLITNKNVKEILSTSCKGCAGTIEIGSIDIENLRKAVEACDNCK